MRGLMKGHIAAPLIEAWRAGRFTLVTSEMIMAEIAAVLTRPKFRKYFALPEVTELLELIAEQGEIVEPVEHLEWCRDPKDNVFLDVAVAGKAAYLVTGDDDLKGDATLKTNLQRAYGVKIVSVPELLIILDRPRGCLPWHWWQV
ncbi:MAG: putative toxin-antitoxin system toxin component, PIN family [Chloroflexota bacterium]